ncbi:hypothetical protein WB44_08945 [Synechococcus sp. WH 8020]|nr:hypothetical protein WB44_08945 [Synechococcus sp. WH 8020]
MGITTHASYIQTAKLVLDIATIRTTAWEWVGIVKTENPSIQILVLINAIFARAVQATKTMSAM